MLVFLVFFLKTSIKTCNTDENDRQQAEWTKWARANENPLGQLVVSFGLMANSAIIF